jgi:hypothetical protein
MAVRGRILCARWEIRAFRGIERFADYKKINVRMGPIIHYPTSAHIIKDKKRPWRSRLSDRGLTGIIAVGTIALVLIGIATLVVMLL